MSALALRIFACVCMLLDHIGYCMHDMSLRYIGRLAFPIFIFLMVNGFRHSKSRLRYAGRFALFALLSQIPFSLLCYGELRLDHWNVMVTLLLGLAVIWLGELLRKAPKGKIFCFFPAMLSYFACYFGYIRTDYSEKGILFAVIFWLLDGKYLWICLCSVLTVMQEHLFSCILHLFFGNAIHIPDQWDLIQRLSLLSLPFLFSYNGQAGNLPRSAFWKKALQLCFYIFYPLHMLLLWLLLGT